jgi:hypothetical protein
LDKDTELPPPPTVFHSILGMTYLPSATMTKNRSKSKLLTQVQEEEISQPSESITQIEEKNNNNNLGVEHEIECPRCHDIMTLQSEFDRLGYVCEECYFLVYFN